MRNSIKFLGFVLLLATVACSQPKKAEIVKENEAREMRDFSIRYIANEGVLIRAGGKQILIDGLHREYKPAYAFPPAELQKSLENAQKPYDKINLVLASHVHLDHFHHESVGSHLKNNPRAIFASSEQAVNEISKNYADYEKIKSQIKPIRHEWKKAVAYGQDAVKVRFLGLRHANAQHASIQNFGHLIEIGGKKLLHIGDADMTAENFAAFDLAKESIDVAFIPYWFLLSEDGRRLVEEQFAPKRIVAVHIPPNEAAEISARLDKESPATVALTKILEETNF
ncbi:MAG TPA: MBL fold metallo-hydrolase [Pyrinomonadaceae bacterium]|jgi:L-ascorbate metabolism protein UlaG (beta-lactamase superfamily)